MRIIDSRYELLEKIGAGAYGQVYRARDQKTDGYVALKLLEKGNLGTDKEKKRFQAELQALAQLHNPHTVRVTDSGDDGDDLFIVMEYLQGQTLAALLRREAPLSTSRAARITVQVLRALEEAHQKGIVHGDIKPGNIMLSGERSQESVKLIDFGVARLAGMTQTVELAENRISPLYTSPEQAGGVPGRAQSDLYALGVVLFEMLTGAVPFADGNVQTILQAHLHRKHTWPAQAQKAVPKALRTIVDKALQKKPASRYSSAGQMRKALEACLEGTEKATGGIGRLVRIFGALAGLIGFWAACEQLADFSSARWLKERWQASQQAGKRASGKKPPRHIPSLRPAGPKLSITHPRGASALPGTQLKGLAEPRTSPGGTAPTPRAGLRLLQGLANFCLKHEVRLRIRPYHRLLQARLTKGKARHIKDGLCIPSDAGTIALSLAGYTTCTFSFKEGRKTLALYLAKVGQGATGGSYCVKSKPKK